MHPSLLGFLEKLPLLSSEQTVGEALLHLFKEMGADGGNIWFAVGDEAGENPSAAVTNSVTDYSEEYLAVQYSPDLLDRAEIPRIVEGRHAPFRYGFEMDRHRFGEESVDTVQAKAAQDLMGLRNALIIPVPTVGKQGSSGVSFYSTGDADQFEQLWRDKGLAFAYAAHAAHLRMQQLSVTIAAPAIPLTAREKDCLLWTARGLRAKEIAHRLDIRQVTVGLHLANARKKMDAQTLPEAVVKAVMARLIAP
jgi:DNA-binding CsgD family transcriptional regulator